MEDDEVAVCAVVALGKVLNNDEDELEDSLLCVDDAVSVIGLA